MISDRAAMTPQSGIAKTADCGQTIVDPATKVPHLQSVRVRGGGGDGVPRSLGPRSRETLALDGQGTAWSNCGIPQQGDCEARASTSIPQLRARVLVADPPWRFSDKLPGPKRGAEKHYPTLSVAELCSFALPPLADDAYLFLWRVSSMVEEAYEVARSWGFVPKSEIVWLKLSASGTKRHFGMGRHVRAEHETAILAVRGKPKPRVRNVRSTFEAIASRKHSEKPEEFFTLVECLCHGPYVELFARRRRPGWACFGNELGEQP